MEYGFNAHHTQEYTPRQSQILENIFQVAREKHAQGIKLNDIKLFCRSSAAGFYLPVSMFEQKMHEFLADLEKDESPNQILKQY